MSEAPLYIMNGRAHYEMGARERVPHLRATFIKHSRMVSAPAALPPDPSPDILRFCGSLQGENQRHRAMGGMSAGCAPGLGIVTHSLKLDALQYMYRTSALVTREKSFVADTLQGHLTRKKTPPPRTLP